MADYTVEHLGIKGFKYTNWAETYTSFPELYFEPESAGQVRQILEAARRYDKTVRVVGNGHSPSDIACTDDYMISLKRMNKVLQIDKDKHIVKAEGGILISHLNEILAENGLGISVLGSVSDLSLAGVMSTGTHGTGGEFKCIASYVLEMELMCASGDVITVSRDRDEETFLAAAVSLGALGVILTITLQCEPAFMLQQTQYPAKLNEVLETLDTHIRSSDHFRFMWFPHTDGVLVFHSKRTKETKPTPGNSWVWDHLIGYWLFEFLLWISSMLSCLVPYINKLYYKYFYSYRAVTVNRSDKIFNFDCLFRQYVTEWAIPRSQTACVLFELKAWIENSGFKAHFPAEVRFVKGDDLYLSPSHGRDTCFINIISYRPYNKFVPHEEYWRAFERIMAEAGGRPHWAKAHSVTAKQFAQMYPKWGEFCKIRQRMDPQGRFLNNNLQRFFGETTG